MYVSCVYNIYKVKLSDKSDEKRPSTFRQLKESGYSQHVFHFMYEVALFQAKDVHGHFAGIKMDAQCLGGFHQLFQRGHVVFPHQVAEYPWTCTEKVETAAWGVFQASHEEAEQFGEPVATYEGTSLLLFDGIQSLKSEEQIDFVAYGRCSGGQGEGGCQTVEVAAESNDREFFIRGCIHGFSVCSEVVRIL